MDEDTLRRIEKLEKEVNRLKKRPSIVINPTPYIPTYPIPDISWTPYNPWRPRIWYSTNTTITTGS